MTVYSNHFELKNGVMKIPKRRSILVLNFTLLSPHSRRDYRAKPARQNSKQAGSQFDSSPFS